MSEFALNTDVFALTASAGGLAVIGQVVFHTWGMDINHSKVALIIGASIYLIGIIVLAASLILWKDDRSRPGLQGEIDGSQVNESGLFGVISCVLVIVGVLLLVKYLYFDKSKVSGILGLSIFLIGWLGVSLSASMDDRRFKSIDWKRIAWNIPGIFALIAGAITMKWQQDKKLAIGPALPLYTLGWGALIVGNSWIINS
jgi:hypothetical protein